MDGVRTIVMASSLAKTSEFAPPPNLIHLIIVTDFGLLVYSPLHVPICFYKP